MHRDDYRSAMNKIALSDDARAALLANMEKARQGEAMPAKKKGAAVMLRRWALPAAAALVLLAVPLGVYASGRLGAENALAAAPRASSAAVRPDSAPSAQQTPAESETPGASSSQPPARQPAASSQEEPAPGLCTLPLAPAPSETGTPMPDMGVQFYSRSPQEQPPAQQPAPQSQEPPAASESAPPPEQPQGTAPAADAPLVTEEIDLAKMNSDFVGRVARLDTLASGNPTRDLAQEALPTELPLYKTGPMDAQTAKEAVTRLADALGLTVDTWLDDAKNGTLSGVSGPWTLSCTDSTITVFGSGVLMQRGTEVKDADLGRDFAQRLASLSGTGKFAWEQLGSYDADKRFSGNLRLYVASSGEGLENDLYHYCFERLALTLDGAGNVVGLTASVPQLAQVQASQALRPLADASAALDETLGAGQQVLHYELVYVHSDTDKDAIVPSYKFTVATGESLDGYFTDGDPSGYAVVRTLYVDALAAE